MYEKQKIEFDWKGFLLKLAFLIIVLILIIKLLPLKKNENKTEKSETFISNLEVMKNTGNTYFTKEKLPTENGENIKISLKNLISVGAIRTLRDTDGEPCNEEDSFINATKINDSHKLEIYLTCGNEKETVTLDIKLNDEEESTTTTIKTTTKKTTNNNNSNIKTTARSTTLITKKVVKTTTTANKVIVIFNTNGGTTINSQYITKGSTATRPANPVKHGYTFVEWTSLNKSFNFNLPVDNNIILVAKWKANTIDVPNKTNPTTSIYNPITKYTVIFDTKGGTPVYSQLVDYGSNVYAPSNPIKANAIFEGWYYNNKLFNFNTRIYNNIILTAKYTVTKTLTENVYASDWGGSKDVVTVQNTLKIPTALNNTNYQEVRIKSLNFVRSLITNSDLDNFRNYNYRTFEYTPTSFDYRLAEYNNFAYINNAYVYKTNSNLYDRNVTWYGIVQNRCLKPFNYLNVTNACLYGILYQVTWEYKIVE